MEKGNCLHLKYRNTETGETSPYFHRVVGRRVTINPRYHFKQYFTDEHQTIFNEVEVVPYREAVPPEILAAVRPPVWKPMSEKAFFTALIETLKASIEETWNPEKHHVIFHSAGWDSRVMAAVIKRIHGERGDGWLGDVTFTAWGKEAREAVRIIEAGGWNPDDFVALPKNEDYFKHGFNFADVWRGLNGVSGYPVNNPQWGVDALRRRRLIPLESSDIQVWSASWFNETIRCIVGPNPPAFEQAFLAHCYYCVNAQFGAAFDFEFVQPLYNPASLRCIAEARVPFTGAVMDVRRRLVAHLSRRLAGISRPNAAGVSVPADVFNRTRREYGESEYGRRRPDGFAGATREIKYAPWWAAWSAASLCEALTRNGVKIRYD